jgi:hypothetical protein
LVSDSSLKHTGTKRRATDNATHDVMTKKIASDSFAASAKKPSDALEASGSSREAENIDGNSDEEDEDEDSYEEESD